jgi:uncharacterized membrane protein
MEKQTKPQRNAVGKIIKWTFIVFNILMLVWLIGGVGSASSEISEIQDEASRAGAEIGTGLGAMMIIFVWMAGAVVLGILTYFSRAKRA